MTSVFPVPARPRTRVGLGLAMYRRTIPVSCSSRSYGSFNGAVGHRRLKTTFAKVPSRWVNFKTVESPSATR